ncbi:MAG: choice-of-anchor V domain-containing protein [Polyangiaceae bacterium]
MRRAGSLIAGLFAGVAVFSSAALAPRAAHAFHAGTTFLDPPALGGGGGILYLGVRAERGWTCAMCHIDAPGNIKIAIDSDPPELASTFEWEPGVQYDITVRMVVTSGEERGLANPISNFNGFGVTFEDRFGRSAGKPSGAADVFQDVNFTTLLTVGTNPGETEWQFRWTAPVAGAGPITMHVAVVDGNSGGVSAGEAFTDPLGDDLVVSAIALTESGTTATREPARDEPPSRGNPRHAEGVALGVAALAIGLAAKRRRGSGAPKQARD